MNLSEGLISVTRSDSLDFGRGNSYIVLSRYFNDTGSNYAPLMMRSAYIISFLQASLSVLPSI